MRWFLFLIFLTISLGCEKSPNPYRSEKESICNISMKRAATKIEKELDLHPFGSGGGITPKVRMLALSFLCYRDLSLEEGRELLLRAVQIFLDEINSSREIKPYLLNDPFAPQNVQVSIFLKHPQGESDQKKHFCRMVAMQGNLRYNVRGDSNQSKSTTIFAETYEEALERAEAKNKSIAAL